MNKQKECTSHDVVSQLKRIFHTKVGHTGTLDPMATGVLPILLGEGTKLSKYLIEHDKIYEVELQLGQKTQTADSEGKVIDEKEVNVELLNAENVKEVLTSMLGKQMQLPPMYSAIKINGKKLYEYARKGQTIEVPPREIEIYQIELKQIDLKHSVISFTVHCSKGTYIRSICETIAQKLETVGYMKELNRITVGKFTIENAVLVEEVEKQAQNQEWITKHIMTIEDILKEKQKIVLTEKQIQLFLNGVKLTQDLPNDIYRIYDQEEKFIGSGEITNCQLKRDIIIV